LKTLEKLQTSSCDVASLQSYLANNFQDVYDLLNYTKHSYLKELTDQLNRYILLNRRVILELDVQNNINMSFISLLISISERLGLISTFRFLFEHLSSTGFYIGCRLEAASLYLIGIKSSFDYLDRYDEILEKLLFSFNNEEDDSDKVLMTIAQYYSLVLADFGQFNIDVVYDLQSKLLKSCYQKKYSFLNTNFINEILKVGIVDSQLAQMTIQKLLDSFLGRELVWPEYNNTFVIEIETIYEDNLRTIPCSFSSIRNLSVTLQNNVAEDDIFVSLQRGVKPLETEDQLFSYMKSYGKMHYHKNISSFKYLRSDFFNKTINIVDWGCGQGIASISFFDYLSKARIIQKINKIYLIEPSILALKRASLHVKKYDNIRNSDIITINKDLDSLSNGDINVSNGIATLHLFSNILDIDSFSITKLLKFIRNSFIGENYFICVSPYINDLKTSRINSFVTSLTSESCFNLLKTVDNKKGEWINNWSRVLRVFSFGVN